VPILGKIILRWVWLGLGLIEGKKLSHNIDTIFVVALVFVPNRHNSSYDFSLKWESQCTNQDHIHHFITLN